MVLTKTRPTPAALGERRPEPEGRAGYLRIDTVHQGDRNGVKGVYHINAVDEVTQWQIVGATPHISEAWLKPVLESMLEQFPFHIRGSHSLECRGRAFVCSISSLFSIPATLWLTAR
jgi:hypothetical protein